MPLKEHPKISSLLKLIVVSVSVALVASFVKLLLMALDNQLNVLSMIGTEVNPALIKTFADKLQFTVKYWIPLVLWLLFNIVIVMCARLSNGAIVPNTDIEYRVANQRNILAQTMEQLVFALGTQAAVLPYLTATQVINIIPLLNCFFILGRLIFWLGYPWYRSPGVGITMYPHSLTFFFLVANFLQEHKLIDLPTLSRVTHSNASMH